MNVEYWNHQKLPKRGKPMLIEIEGYFLFFFVTETSLRIHLSNITEIWFRIFPDILVGFIIA